MALVERACIVCGSLMTTSRGNKQVCSASCHGKAARLRTKQNWTMSELVNHYHQLKETTPCQD
jgi:predicted nucleic acid-binding Zn ribbon protein